MLANFLTPFLASLAIGATWAVSFPDDLVKQINELKTVGELVKAKEHRSTEMQRLFEAKLKGLENKPLPKVRKVDARTVEIGEGLRALRVEAGANPGEIILNQRHLQMTPESTPEDLWSQVEKALPKQREGAGHWFWPAAHAEVDINRPVDPVLAGLVVQMQNTRATWFGCKDVQTMVEACKEYMTQVKARLRASDGTDPNDKSAQAMETRTQKNVDDIKLAGPTSQVERALNTFWSSKALDNQATCAGKEEGRGRLMICKYEVENLLKNMTGTGVNPPLPARDRDQLNSLIKTIDQASGKDAVSPVPENTKAPGTR